MPAATARSISSDGARGARAAPTRRDSATCGTGAACSPSDVEDRFVKSVFALQQLVDAAQILARLRALNHAVIVGARHLHDFAKRRADAATVRSRLPNPGG